MATPTVPIYGSDARISVQIPSQLSLAQLPYPYVHKDRTNKPSRVAVVVVVGSSPKAEAHLNGDAVAAAAVLRTR